MIDIFNLSKRQITLMDYATHIPTMYSRSTEAFKWTKLYIVCMYTLYFFNHITDNSSRLLRIINVYRQCSCCASFSNPYYFCLKERKPLLVHKVKNESLHSQVKAYCKMFWSSKINNLKYKKLQIFHKPIQRPRVVTFNVTVNIVFHSTFCMSVYK